jgi:hypothetical protein
LTALAGNGRQLLVLRKEGKMAATDFDFDFIRSEVRLYQAESEAWKLAHRSAMRCRALERRIAFGVFIFKQITRVDEDWRKEMFAGGLPFSEQIETAITEAYRNWGAACVPFLRAIDDMAAEGYEVEGAAEFRHCCREVRGILTSDKDFFCGSEFATLRDAAVEAHRNGTTEGISELHE